MRTLSFALVLLLLPSICFADEILTYTGNTYSVININDGSLGQVPDVYLGQNATATIDLANALPFSSTVVVNPLSFSVNDGFEMITNSDISSMSAEGSYSSFEFETDNTGAITGWDVVVDLDPGIPGEIWSSSFNIESAGGNDYVQRGFNSQDAMSFVAGTWTESTLVQSGDSTVPEPSAWPLVLIGLLLTVAAGRGRRHSYTVSPGTQR